MAKSLDWSKLPEPLRYLAAPAERYGTLQFDDPIYDFLIGRMTAGEKAELSALRTRYAADSAAIDAWLDRFPMTKHREARLVYFTGHLLALGGDFGFL